MGLSIRREIVDEAMNSCDDCTGSLSVVYFSLSQSDPKGGVQKISNFYTTEALPFFTCTSSNFAACIKSG